MTVFQGVPVGTPEPFRDLPDKGKIELLFTYVDWDGFDDAQLRTVIQRVMGGDDPSQWMAGIEPSASTKPAFAEMLRESPAPAVRTADEQQAKEREPKDGLDR